MSNKTQLQTNNATINDYIIRINAAKNIAASLPEAGSSGGSSGGGSVETCTVTISYKYGYPNHSWISATRFINGNIEPFTYIDYNSSNDPDLTSPLTIDNIVKNSVLTISGNGGFIVGIGGNTCIGCEICYVSVGTGTIAIKVTNPNASIEIENFY